MTPALIVINGPPAVGKSTLARMYANEHPLALRIDVDELRDGLGHWWDAPEEAGSRARAMAAAMAREHLSSGHDVVIAQLYGRADHLDALEATARDVGCRFYEIIVTTDVASTLERFERRGGPRWQETLDGPSGLNAIADLHERVEEIARLRPQATVVESLPGDPTGTYQALLRLIRHREPDQS